MKVTNLKAELNPFKSELIATFNLDNEPRVLTLNPFDFRVLDINNTDILGFTQILIKKEYPLCEF